MTHMLPQAAMLPRSIPEAQGTSSTAIGAFIVAAERELNTLHSVMLLRHGYVIAEGWWEPYRREDLHLLHSLSKSFTATAIGLLVAEGKLTLDDPVIGFFPNDVPAVPSTHLKAMRLRHLLTMSTGHVTEPLMRLDEQTGQTWVQTFLNYPIEHAPGTHFLYNSLATYMLSAIVQAVAGERMLAYLQPRLFAPLGIRNPTWETSPEGINTGGWGLSATTEDIAAFGQLHLQRGIWQGVHVLPAAWVEEATARHVSTGLDPTSDWAQGYGYQFWRCRYDAYRGDGAFGQFCIVMPEQDAVVAITGGLRDMQQVLSLVWEHLLPSMRAAPLPPNSAAQEALAQQLTQLRLRTPHGQATSSVAEHVSGKRFALGKNDDTFTAIRFDFGADTTLMTIGTHAGDQQIACGYATWVRGTAILERTGIVSPTGSSNDTPWKVAASGAWTDEGTYVAQFWWYETPYARTWTCRFAGNHVRIEQQVNVSFGPTEQTHLEGYVA